MCPEHDRLSNLKGLEIGIFFFFQKGTGAKSFAMATLPIFTTSRFLLLATSLANFSLAPAFYCYQIQDGGLKRKVQNRL